jgi:spermidine synthase
MSDIQAEMPECVNYVIDDARDYMASHQNESVDMVILDDARTRPRAHAGRLCNLRPHGR